MSNDPDTNNFDPLDDLLAGAEWEQPTGDSLERLRAAYLAARRRQARMVIYGRLAVAATIILAGGIGIHLARSQPRTPVAHRVDAPRTESRDPYVRLPTLMERAILLRPEVAMKGPTPAQVEQRVEAALAVVAGAPESAPAQAVVLGQLNRPDIVERRLMAAAGDKQAARRIAGATLLAESGSARALGLAAALLKSPGTREAGLTLVGRLADNAALVQIASETPADVQRELLGTLLRRGTREAIGQYLECVAHSPMAEAALAAAMPGTAKGVVDVLVERLADRDLVMSFAAARTLGRIDGPELTERLARMIHDNAKRRQAILALLCMPTPRAQKLLAEARSRPADSWAVRSVERELDRIQ